VVDLAQQRDAALRQAVDDVELPQRAAPVQRAREDPGDRLGELAAQLPVSRPAVSQHLRVLKDAGLVEDEAVGARRVYKLHPEGIAELRSYLDGFWSRSLRAFKAAAEAGEEEDR